MMGFDQGKSCHDGTFAGEILNVFLYHVRINGHRVKLGAQLDSSDQIGLESTSYEFFDRSGDPSKSDEDGNDGILKIGKLRTFWIAESQSVVI